MASDGEGAHAGTGMDCERKTFQMCNEFHSEDEHDGIRSGQRI